ncbi:MAG: hypothetical protein AAF329_00350 [Cyanobacteria bacterium P01_A01_bin.17]
MTDPITLTVGAIAGLAFTKFLDTSASEAAKTLTPVVIDKMDALRKKIWAKLRGIPAVDELKATVEQGGKITEQQIQLLTPHLEAAMQTDPAFAEEVQQIARQISQEINIGEILGRNVQNVYGGTAVQINDPNAPVIQGVSGGTVNINYN